MQFKEKIKEEEEYDYDDTKTIGVCFVAHVFFFF